MSKEAMKLALEALENPWKAGPDGVADAIIAIKEALAQPSVSVEQEPVAFVKGCNRGQWEIFPAKAHQIFEREQPLYTTPPQRKPLTDGEARKFYEKYTNREELIYAIDEFLEEKNT